MEFKMKKQWWSVTTGYSNNEDFDCGLGTYYGYVDEIALHLATRAEGFYQEVGTLIFTPVSAPEKKLKPHGDKVNIIIDNEKFGTTRPDAKLLKAMQRYFKGRPVTIEDSDYYGNVLLRANDKKSRRKIRQKSA
jgi:hypothetical protein